MALPGNRYQMPVGNQQVYDLFPLRCVRPELGLPHPGDDSPGWYGAVFLLYLLPFFTEHHDGLVGQPGDLLRGSLDRVGPDQLTVPGDDGLCLVDLGAGVVDMLPGVGYAVLQRPDIGQGGGVPGRLLLGPGPEASLVEVVRCVCQGVELG